MRVTGILAGSGILAVLIQPLVLKIPFIRVVLDWAVLQAIHSPTTFVCVSPVRFHNFQQAVLFLFRGKENWEMAREIFNKKRICYAGARVTRWHELVPKRGARTTWRHKLVLKQGSRSFWRRGCFVSANSTSRAEKYGKQGGRKNQKRMENRKRMALDLQWARNQSWLLKWPIAMKCAFSGRPLQ